MPFIKATALLPPENEQVLIHDNQNNRLHLGRYIKGRWYTEDPHDGHLTEIHNVTHWALLLDSELQDDSDDD
jgi:hypothetical protein